MRQTRQYANTAASSTAIPPEMYAQTMARSPDVDRDMAYPPSRFEKTLNTPPTAPENDRIRPIQSLRRLDIMQHNVRLQARAACGHSITRSARANNEGGISRPIAFAIGRFTVSRNLAGCWIGRSPGL